MPQQLTSYLGLVGWTLVPVAAGLVLRRRGAPKALSRYLFLFALFGCQTLIVFMAVWVATIAAGAAAMPLLTLAGWLATVGVARGVSGWLCHRPHQRGAFMVAMALSNHGYTLLGLIAMVLFGEAGIAQASYAQLFAVPFIVFVCFPVGRFYGEGEGRMPLAALVRKTLADPMSLPAVAMFVGVGLNLAGVARPAWCGHVVRVLVYVGTVATGVAVGMLLDGVSPRRYWRENVVSFTYRSTLFPLLFYALAVCAGLDRLNTCVLVLFGLVPAALFSNLIADFFGLDTDLASSMFLTSTVLFVVLILPVYVLAAAPA